MNRLFQLLGWVLLCGWLSCSNADPVKNTYAATEKTDTCKLDPNNTYEVYIPQRNNDVKKLPLLVIIDSHGGGKFALEKFKEAANQFPAVLIASNLVKNNYGGYQEAIQTLIVDARQKYPIGETVFMTGFSGGARMVLGYALNHQVDGLIMCGALANSDQIKTLSCPLISISGMDDFNFMETAQYLFQEQSIPDKLKIELINASHSWPDNQVLANALGFLRFSCKASDMPPQSKSQLKMYCQHQQSKIDSLKQSGDFLKAALLARNMASTEPFSDKTFASTYEAIKTNTEYISQMNRLEKYLNYEISVRQQYIDAFQTKDTLWWKNEIRTIEEKIKTEQDSYLKDTYLRIKAFWGIASYSLCNQAVKGKNAEVLNKILSIYRMLEPENPDMFYFSAFPYFWKKNNEATYSMLNKALEAGYTNMGQLERNFPESITARLF